jgi:hypothetical protein
MLKVILVAPLIAALPASPPGSQSVLSLYCNNIATAYGDAGEAVVLQKATLRNDYFAGWFELAVGRDVLRRIPNLTLEHDWGMAYQLDGAGIAAVHPMVKTSSLTLVLAFPHLPAGAHHLRVGLLDREGNLAEGQSYCFSTPDNAVFDWPKDGI